MLRSTLPRLRCPVCQGALSLSGSEAEVLHGELACGGCRKRFPILAGVAVLVEDVHEYLLAHVKGISQIVPDAEIPKAIRRDFREARESLEDEHIEEDLEAERVVSLYLLNHYLNARGESWWKPAAGTFSPLIDSLIREHWDNGPLAKIAAWVPNGDVVEIGCGVGGLARMLRGGSYLGVDSSFASIALARHLVLGAPYPRPVRVPEDLLNGQVSREVRVEYVKPAASADFVVGDITAFPAARGAFDTSVVLNAIDMLEEPVVLPELQRDLVRAGGMVIQSCPYIWHAQVAAALREELPRDVRDSASAVEWLYEHSGLRVEKRQDHVPWLFFKHARQLEIYSVHIFQARKA